MASTFKNLSPNDKISTKTLLHEAIPLTGTILSGTYSDLNIKNYSHGMFQSVFDYPYLSSSANHIFDITTGFANDSALSASSPVTEAQQSKKINIYNQMAQVLVGYDKTGSIQQFDEDGDLSAGTKLKECAFLSFSRLLVKDEIKRGSFQLKLGVGQKFSDPFASTIVVKDHKAETNYKINSPVGEYGVLYATGSALDSTLTGSGDFSGHVKCGLIYYQAGVAVLSGSVFKADNATAVIKTVSAAKADYDAKAFTLISADGTSKTYSIANGGALSTGQTDGSGHVRVQVSAASNQGDVATQIKAAIDHANGHNAGSADSKLIVRLSTTTNTNDTVTITQATAGATGNKTIAAVTNGDASVFTINGGIAETAFSGGGDGGILSSTIGTTRLQAAADNNSFDTTMKNLSISGSADALRHRIQNIQFNNTVELNSSIYFCRINHNEYNYSANPTYLSASQIRVKEKASDTPVSYITTVGLYSADNQLLAVGKLSEPLRKDPTIEYTLRARLDY